MTRQDRSPVDVQGETKLDLSDLEDGTYTLRLVPYGDQLTTERAGPNLLPGAAKLLYRTLDVAFTWRGGKLSAQKPPSAVPGADNGRVMSFTGNTLTIDWKPDSVVLDRIDCPGEHFDWPKLERMGLIYGPAAQPLPAQLPRPTAYMISRVLAGRTG